MNFWLLLCVRTSHYFTTSAASLHPSFLTFFLALFTPTFHPPTLLWTRLFLPTSNFFLTSCTCSTHETLFPQSVSCRSILPMDNDSFNCSISISFQSIYSCLTCISAFFFSPFSYFTLIHTSSHTITSLTITTLSSFRFCPDKFFLRSLSSSVSS